VRGENQKIEGWLGDAAKNEIFLNGELEALNIAIASLETKLSGVTLELEAREQAIAKLKTELEDRGNIKQLNLFPPKPEPEITRTLTRGELVKHILEKFPNSNMNGQKITDAIAGKSKNLPKFEGEYGFKYLGKIKGENRFSIP
jgi:hypothetical protein